jgi:hypothetical protein
MSFLQDLRNQASGSTAKSPDPANEANGQTNPGWSSDFKGLFLILFFLTTIVTSIGWYYCRQYCAVELLPPPSREKVYDWCPPERAECLHR